MIRSTIALRYTPAAGERVDICKYGQPLLEEPEAEWELQTQTCNLIAREWAEDRPTGNSRRRVAIRACVSAPGVAALVRHMTRVELAANTQREGEAVWQDAFVDGLPTISIGWRALVMACKSRILPVEDAPDPKVVWGCIEWELQLTRPREI